VNTQLPYHLASGVSALVLALALLSSVEAAERSEAPTVAKRTENLSAQAGRGIAKAGKNVEKGLQIAAKKTGQGLKQAEKGVKKGLQTAARAVDRAFEKPDKN